MRAVFINHCHPDMDHVCALRMRLFAEAMAEKGHRIVVLSGSLSADSRDLSMADHRHNLAAHDWSKPYILPCQAAPAALLERLHQGRLPDGFRQVVVAAGYLFHGGVFNNWRRGAGSAVRLLAEDFAPDIVWATFGNTDAWNLAQDLAGLAGCPWVADMKDNWDHYIPGPFRDLLARRYGGAAHFTALSQGHADLVARRFGVPASVIYSGFGSPRDVAPEAPRIVVSGSIYDGAALAVMVRGIDAWLDEAPPDRPMEVCYFGNDHQLAETILAPLDGRCRVLVRSYLEPAELAPILAGATVILCPRHPPMLYHHKFGDYMATGRPVICLPGETAECRGIAESINAPLFSCDTAGQVVSALRAVAANDFPTLDKSLLDAYSWRNQAGALEYLLVRAANR